ncbi:MAG: universal stress protein [Ginsengibacter sp.]
MKDILVPIDFSEASFNAMHYAAFLANAFSANLIVMHAYTGTQGFDETLDNQVYDSIEELDEANEQFLKNEINGVIRNFTIKAEGIISKGSAPVVIKEIAEKRKVSLIVMGMKGKGESNSIFGSTTTAMVTKVDSPLLVVPQNAPYEVINNITIATDFTDEKLPPNWDLLASLIEKFNAFVQILNIRKKNEEHLEKIIADKHGAAELWNNHAHSFNIIESDDVVDGINKFLHSKPTDLLVMISRKRNFLERIWGVSHTKEMTKQVGIPMLVLHEENE